MKNVVILHGTSETKESFWFPWLTKELEKRGYAVSLPPLPNPDTPDLKDWLPTALKENYTSKTVLVNIDVKIKQAIIVAGYARPKGKDKEPEKILQNSYDWQKIKNNVEEIIFINSDNDPWGCNDEEGKIGRAHV